MFHELGCHQPATEWSGCHETSGVSTRMPSGSVRWKTLAVVGNQRCEAQREAVAMASARETEEGQPESPHQKAETRPRPQTPCPGDEPPDRLGGRSERRTANDSDVED